MAQNIHFHYKREEWEHMRKYLIKARPKPVRTNSESYSSISVVEDFSFQWLRRLCPSSSAASSAHIFLELVLFLYIALPDRHPMALASLTFGVSTANQILHSQLHSIILHGLLPSQGWPSCRDFPAICCLNLQLSEPWKKNP